MAECPCNGEEEVVFGLGRGRRGREEACSSGGGRHARVQEVSTTARQLRPGVEESEGEEEVRGRRGCQGEPRRGRKRCRGMTKLGLCKGGLQSQGERERTLEEP